jgi:putative tricarboxylic transport membrane protein
VTEGGAGSREPRRKIEGLFWFLIGLIVCRLAWKFQVGSLREPGSGFIAFILGMALSLLGLVMVLVEVYSKTSGNTVAAAGHPFRGTPLFPFALTGGILFGYGLLLETLGYNVTTLLAMWALFYLFYEKRNRLLLSLFAAFATTATTYLVFEVWLRSQLPRGIFPWW